MSKHFYELQFEIETRCLLDCIHCSSLEMRLNGKRGYSADDLHRFISCFADNAHVYFTGGEPLLFEGLLKLCKSLSDDYGKLSVGLYTTGICSPAGISAQLADQMAHAGIKDCYFSLYSNITKEHDAWTRLSGSFENTISSIKQLTCVGIVPKIHLVLNRYNLHKIENIIEFCQEVGVKEVRILRLAPVGNAKKYWSNIGISIEEQNEVVENLINHKRDFSTKLSFSGYPNLHPCRSFPDAIGCQAGTHLLYVDINGDVFPCACTKSDILRFQIGHITEIDKIKEYVKNREHVLCNETCLNEGACHTVSLRE